MKQLVALAIAVVSFAAVAACGPVRVEAYSAESPTTGPAGASGSGGTGAAGQFGSGGTMGGTSKEGAMETAGGPAGKTAGRYADAGRIDTHAHEATGSGPSVPPSIAPP